MTKRNVLKAKQNVMVLVGHRVRYERELSGLSQADLAQRVGISSVHLLRIESAQSNPTLQAIIRLAEALNISPCDLFSVLPQREQHSGDRDQ